MQYRVHRSAYGRSRIGTYLGYTLAILGPFLLFEHGSNGVAEKTLASMSYSVSNNELCVPDWKEKKQKKKIFILLL